MKFRFRREHVWMLLQELNLLTSDGYPRQLQVGRVGHTQSCRADTALLIMLRKLSYVCRNADLQAELGCSSTLISEAFNSMVDYIFDNFSSKLNRLEPWVDRFPEFAQAISRKVGGMFTNLICFTDGHFQRIARPGGPRNKLSKTSQKMMYNRYYKAHGLKYIVTVFPNGIMLVHGAYAGREHDSPIFKAAGLVQALRRLELAGRGHWIIFGDSAFALSQYVQRMLRGASKRTRAGRRYNRKMARVRVSIENAIGEVLTQWGLVGHKNTNLLGAIPLAKHVSVAVFLHNVQGILYGNQCTQKFGDHLREMLSVSEYIAMREYANE